MAAVEEAMEIDGAAGGAPPPLEVFPSVPRCFQVPSLLSLCKESVRDRIYTLVCNTRSKRTCGFGGECAGKGPDNWSPHVRYPAQMLRWEMDAKLHPEVCSDLLASLIPSEERRWRFPCVDPAATAPSMPGGKAASKSTCKAHGECRVVHAHCDRLVYLLFFETSDKLSVNLSRIDSSLQVRVVTRIADVISRSTKLRCPNLVRLKISGGTRSLDTLLYRSIERLCRQLAKNARNLRELHLPVASNECCESISDMPKLRSLVIERTLDLDHRGLKKLRGSRQLRRNLLSLHLGIERSYYCDKTDLEHFFVRMENLASFSLMEEDRRIFRLDDPHDSKVLTYSIIRLAMVDVERDEVPGYSYRRKGPFKTRLKEIKVVDRELKPEYLLDTCPDLSYLYLDWQMMLTDSPGKVRYRPDWFSDMVRTSEWTKLAGNLTKLHVVFPATYAPNSYSLRPTDFSAFLAALGGLTSLRLDGAGMGAPLPLLELLERAPHLKELTLNKCSIYVPPDPNFILKASYPDMRSFYLTNSSESIAFNHVVLLRAIASLFPSLVHLELQPESTKGTYGFAPHELLPLATLPALLTLSVAVSLRECSNNLPELVVVLRKFPALTNLVLSWGCDNAFLFGHTAGRIRFMMAWLIDVMSENPDLMVNIDSRLHRDV